eukprot:scaffold46248_cov21-Tisochrysis_lutea.AAC.2
MHALIAAGGPKSKKKATETDAGAGSGNIGKMLSKQAARAAVAPSSKSVLLSVLEKVLRRLHLTRKQINAHFVLPLCSQHCAHVHTRTHTHTYAFTRVYAHTHHHHHHHNCRPVKANAADSDALLDDILGSIGGDGSGGGASAAAATAALPAAAPR